MLSRIAKLSFVFSSPPVKTKVGEDVIALLREATRAYLLGLTRSSVCVCRALLEAALKDKIAKKDLELARVESRKKGDLELLIMIAATSGLITRSECDAATDVRRTGNRTLHRAPPSDKVAWDTLLNTRTVISALCR
jgi:hypothetical protein